MRKKVPTRKKPDEEGAYAAACWYLVSNRWALRSDAEIEAAIPINLLRQAALRRIDRLPEGTFPKDELDFIREAVAKYNPPRKQGGQERSIGDQVLADTVEQMKAFGFSPRRNRFTTTSRECGASIVARALKEVIGSDSGPLLGWQRLANIHAAHYPRTRSPG
jgi:hypothetical protein